jgi:hypothetical protein
VTGRLSDQYFDEIYAAAADPWSLGERWYEQRKYAITLAMLPSPSYEHAFEPGCSVGVLTESLAALCAKVTATDVAAGALDATRARLERSGARTRVDLLRLSLDEPWPLDGTDLVVLSEVAYYFEASALRDVLDRECPRLDGGATIVAAHWRHAVADYPMSGDEANEVIAATPGLHRMAGYRDDDVVIDVFTVGASASVAARTDVPGAAG